MYSYITSKAAPESASRTIRHEEYTKRLITVSVELNVERWMGIVGYAE
jgi:hypothetical protein